MRFSKVLVLIMAVMLASCKVTPAEKKDGDDPDRKPGGLKELTPAALVLSADTSPGNALGDSNAATIGTLKKRFGFLMADRGFLKATRVQYIISNCKERNPPEADFFLVQGGESTAMKLKRQVQFKEGVEGDVTAYLYNIGECDILNMKFAVQLDDKLDLDGAEPELCWDWEVSGVQINRDAQGEILRPLWGARSIPCR